MPLPEISIVIPVHNAAETLPLCLKSIASNSDVDYELIVVDDASTDCSGTIVRNCQCRLVQLRERAMAAQCRNIGAAAAQSDIVLFFDADQVMPTGCLENFVAGFRKDPSVAAIVASFAPETPAPGFFSRFKNFRHYYVHQTANKAGATLASGFTAVKRQLFLACGGFEKPFGPASIEDVALGHELWVRGYRIEFRADIQVTHLKSYDIVSLLRSDVRDRAIPWAALTFRDRFWRWDLNTGVPQVMSVLGIYVSVATAVLWPRGWIWCILCSLCWVTLFNNRFLLMGAHQFGWGFATRSALFLPLMYFSHGAGFVLGLLAAWIGQGVLKRNWKKLWSRLAICLPPLLGWQLYIASL